MLREHVAHRPRIGDIGPDQRVARVRLTFLKRIERGGLSHFVDVHDLVARRS
jgi:hypothetical protein